MYYFHMDARKGLVIALITAGILVLGVGGYVLVQKAVSRPLPLDDSGIQQDSTKDWKTYRNEKYGFEFKYPELWQLISEEISVGVHNKVDFSFRTPKPNDTLIPFSIVVYSREEWPEVKGGLEESRSIFKELKGSDIRAFVALLPYHYSIPSGFGFDRTYDTILSTFKFTGQNLADVSGLKTYSNLEYGISFQYPAKYNSKPTDGIVGVLPLFQYVDPNKPRGVPDFIDVKWLPFKSEDNSEQKMMNDVVFDGSGMHPKSFDSFALVRLGDGDFYKIRTGVFEGVLGYRYYLVRESGAFVFTLTSNGVPWTDPTFNPETDPRHVELQQMLKTVRLNN